MYRPICTDRFLAVLCMIGMVKMNVTYRPGSIEYAAVVDVGGTLVDIEGSSLSVTGFHYDVLKEVRSHLLTLVESDGLDTDDSALVLGCMASLDELLHGPSTGTAPGQQALALDDEDE